MLTIQQKEWHSLNLLGDSFLSAVFFLCLTKFPSDALLLAPVHLHWRQFLLFMSKCCHCMLLLEDCKLFHWIAQESPGWLIFIKEIMFCVGKLSPLLVACSVVKSEASIQHPDIELVDCFQNDLVCPLDMCQFGSKFFQKESPAHNLLHIEVFEQHVLQLWSTNASTSCPRSTFWHSLRVSASAMLSCSVSTVVQQCVWTLMIEVVANDLSGMSHPLIDDTWHLHGIGMAHCASRLVTLQQFFHLKHTLSQQIQNTARRWTDPTVPSKDKHPFQHKWNLMIWQLNNAWEELTYQHCGFVAVNENAHKSSLETVLCKFL